MKKLLFLICILPLGLSAQDDADGSFIQGTSDEPSFRNKNGLEALPQAGDWSIGINASTALNYLGNIFSSGGNYNSAMWNYQAGPAYVIQGKYFKTATLAYRAGINLDFHKAANNYDIEDDNGTSPDAYISDRLTTQKTGVTVLVGLEKRKGTGRVQGVYGADVFVGFNSNNKYTYEYGNAITEANQTPSKTASFVNPFGGINPSQGYRITEAKMASNMSAGVQGFIGVEVFVFPKISLGGSFTWGIKYTNLGKSGVSEEAWDAQSNGVKEYTVTSENGYSVDAGIGNLGGTVSANFYF